MKRVVKENGARPQQATLDAAFERLYGQTSRLGFDALIYDYTPVPRSVEES